MGVDTIAVVKLLQEKNNKISELEEENEKLKEEKEFFYKSAKQFREENEKLREELSAYDREYFDEDKKAKNIFIDNSGKVIKGGEFTTLC